MRQAFACVVFVCAACGAGCGGQTPREERGSAACDPAVLTNCPQDTIPDGGECALPPIVGAQGFYTIGCKVTASCNYGPQNCSCVQGPMGPGWACE
jgi:hypothetical protein